MCAGKKKGCSTLADEGRYPAALLGKGLPTNAPGERDGSLDLSRLARAAVQSEVRLGKRQTRCLQQLDLLRRVGAISKVLVIRRDDPGTLPKNFLGTEK